MINPNLEEYDVVPTGEYGIHTLFKYLSTM